MSYIELEMLVTDLESSKLASMYWALRADGEFIHTVDEIARELQMPGGAAVSSKIKNICLAKSTHLHCPTCERPTIFKNRMEFKKLSGQESLKNDCKICLQEKQQKLLKDKSDWIESEYDRRSKFKKSSKDLTKQQRFDLTNALRHLADKNFNQLRPYYTNSHSDTDFELYFALRDLYESYIISVSPSSDPSALEQTDHGFKFEFDSVEWIIQLDLDDNANLQEFFFQQEADIRREKKKIIETYQQCTSNPNFTVESLSFRQAIYLLSVIRHLGSESLETLQPHSSNHSTFLSPNVDYDITVLRHLYSSEIIAVSANSNPDIIDVTPDGLDFPLTEVEWTITLDLSKFVSLPDFVQRLETRLASMEWPEQWYNDAKQLCQEVALAESVAFLNYSLARHDLRKEIGEKTVMVLNKVLCTYSVAQTYNLIWRSAKDAAATHARGAPKYIAANTVVGSIERMYERAITNQWSTTPFKRNFNLPPSVVSEVLFNTTLHTDDGGFSLPVNQIV